MIRGLSLSHGAEQNSCSGSQSRVHFRPKTPIKFGFSRHGLLQRAWPRFESFSFFDGYIRQGTLEKPSRIKSKKSPKTETILETKFLTEVGFRAKWRSL
jgi:hypothetical protein